MINNYSKKWPYLLVASRLHLSFNSIDCCKGSICQPTTHISLAFLGTTIRCYNKYPDLYHYQNFTKKWIDVCENIADMVSPHIVSISSFMLYVGYLTFVQMWISLILPKLNTSSNIVLSKFVNDRTRKIVRNQLE